MTKIYAVDAATGEEVLREMTADEENNYQKIVTDSNVIEREKAKAEIDKAALLAKLGITADEAKLLLS